MNAVIYCFANKRFLNYHLNLNIGMHKIVFLINVNYTYNKFLHCLSTILFPKSINKLPSIKHFEKRKIYISRIDAILKPALCRDLQIFFKSNSIIIF